jgi:hypothetical protein
MVPSTDVAALLSLSRRQFGADAYQAQPRYLDWLYRANPASQGPSDCFVADQDGVPAGCIHRMMLPLTIAGEPGMLASLQNHFMVPHARSGAGMMLLRRAVRDVALGFSPGVAGKLGDVYRRLGYKEVPSYWLARPLSLARAALQKAVAGRLARKPVDIGRLRRRHAALAITASPDEEEVIALSERMWRAGADAGAGVAWRPDLVRWRYFDPAGPHHVLVRRPDGTATAVFSLGPRGGLVVARLMECHGDVDDAFHRDVLRVMRSAGAAAALCYTQDAQLADALESRGWRSRGSSVASFATRDAGLVLGAGATDVGLEALVTEMR